ncbi:MAG: hypothetical protein ABIJ97_05230 [Bacteroidota bacterium]
MKQLILVSIFFLLMLCQHTIKAQESYEIKCKMTIEGIMDIQSFKLDVPEFEKAKKIAEVLLYRFELLYLAINNSNISEAIEQKTIIQSAINSAQIIKMDYSMFDEDLNFINNLDFNK